MRLLEYATLRLGEHPDWPAVRPSLWHELPTLTEVEALSRSEYAEMELGIDYCGGCYQRFEATEAMISANALHHHIEAEPCAHYGAAHAAREVLELRLAV